MADITNESIYNLIPKTFEEPQKPPKYESKFRSSFRDEENTNRAAYKTMGPAKVDTRDPQHFLKKHEKEPKLEEASKFSYGDEERRRPPVPRRDEQPVHGIRTTKNFIKQNAVENILSVPKKPEKLSVDTKKGDKQHLTMAGLEPNYINKKEYGKTPKYLSQRQEEMRKAQEEYDNYVHEHFKRGAMKQLSDGERDNIIDGLKKNWEDIHRQYQGLSVVTDTAPKKNRKERMEADMKQLERDIELLEKHRTIYIAN